MLQLPHVRRCFRISCIRFDDAVISKQTNQFPQEHLHTIQEVSNTSNLPTLEQIAISRAVAYAGELGRKREKFCEEYARFKTHKINEIQNLLAKDIESKHLSNTCSRGCSACCSQFIVVSLQEAETIAYFLYQNEAQLKNFIAALPAWMSNIAKNGAVFHELRRLCRKINDGKATEEDFQKFDAAGRTYAGNDCPCPFLVDRACSIYPVRPFVCANYYSVTPPDLCQVSNPEHHKAVHVKIKQLGKDFPYFIPVTRNRILHPMPLFVHDILREGFDALAVITGKQELRREMRQDPAVKAILKNMGISN